MALSKVRKGDAAVLFFATLLTEADLLVLQTFTEAAPFDLAVYHEGVFWRFQIKRAQRERKKGFFYVPFRKITTNTKGFKVYRYTEEHTDFLVGVVMETLDVYCFPIAETSHIKATVTVDPLGEQDKRFQAGRKVDAERYRNVVKLGDTRVQLKSSDISVGG